MSPWRWKVDADAGALAEVRHLGGERGDEAVVVERGRAQRARERQQLLHRLGGERLDLLELRAQPGRDVERGGLQAQQDRGQGLVDLVVQVLGDARALLLLGADDGAAALDALLLEAGEHAVEVGGQALDLARALCGRVARWPGEDGSTRSIVASRRSSGASRRLSSSVLMQHGADDGERRSAAALRGATSLRVPGRAARRSIAVAATSAALTARTWFKRERVRTDGSHRQMRLRVVTPCFRRYPS